MTTKRYTEGDVPAPWTRTLQDRDGNVVDLSNATEVLFLLDWAYDTPARPKPTRLRRALAGTPVVKRAATVETPATAGQATVAWQDGDLDDAGHFHASWRVTFSDGTVRAYPEEGYDTVLVQKGLD